MTDEEWDEYEEWFIEMNSNRILKLMDRRRRFKGKNLKRLEKITEEILSLYRLGRAVLGRPWHDAFTQVAYWEGDWATGGWKKKQ